MGMIYLTPKEVSERYRGTISTRTLANWRSIGDGPRFTKVGGRVLYALTAIEEWEKRRTRGMERGA